MWPGQAESDSKYELKQMLSCPACVQTPRAICELVKVSILTWNVRVGTFCWAQAIKEKWFLALKVRGNSFTLLFVLLLPNICRILPTFHDLFRRGYRWFRFLLITVKHHLYYFLKQYAICNFILSSSFKLMLFHIFYSHMLPIITRNHFTSISKIHSFSLSVVNLFSVFMVLGFYMVLWLPVSISNFTFCLRKVSAQESYCDSTDCLIRV